MKSYPYLQLLALGLCLAGGWLAGAPAGAHGDTQNISSSANLSEAGDGVHSSVNIGAQTPEGNASDNINN